MIQELVEGVICLWKIPTRMSQAESPKAEIGGCMRDAAQAELNGVNGLMHKDLTKVKWLEKKKTNPVKKIYTIKLSHIKLFQLCS